MPRIRSIKPETWTSETLAEVSIPAMVTFLAMTNMADDWGRHRDNAAIIFGIIWPLRAEHGAVQVEDDLTQLENAGAICRYTGCDGKRYFHYPTWFKHQKIDTPSQSRLPACPKCEPQRCGVCKGPCTQRAENSPKAPGDFPEGSENLPGTPEPPEQPTPTRRAPARTAPAPAQDTAGTADGTHHNATEKTAGQTGFAEASRKAPGRVGEPSGSGSRISDPGSFFPTGRDAPDEASVSAKELIGEYVASCRERPPGDVIGHLGGIAKKLLAEGIAVEHVRAGLRRFAEIQGHPSRLPSLVNDAMNAPATGLARLGFRPNVPAHTAWTNPVDAATAYSEEL
ncbi:hypothetical protein [Actinacidiphila guanduensis]|uniref:Helix-turn-helix DNA binding domain protein n=1 Tax=Actinacidiphila guanduensis TaxID=310781 RepID=A0A1H0SHX7_9ACTN|nr:hypothetical protein [Actinacidiphila guanduensis]SDP41412.1 hypothetical protein SAMN05216259_12839 [Actinacidiphila guanduensis]